LEKAGTRDLSFLGHPRYRKYLISTRAAAVILKPENRNDCPAIALVVENPTLAYAQAAALLHPVAHVSAGIHSSAFVHPSSQIAESAQIGPHCVIEAGVGIGEQVSVGPGCVIGKGASLGDGCRLVANVTVCADVKIGQRALIHPGAVLGSDGFGLANDRGRWVKVPQLGGLRIGDDVEVGANTTIDRGSLDDTIIEDGVKLDNLIQIAHNVTIGAHTAIAACVGIAGSARIGRRCSLGGASVVLGHLEVADDVHITAMTLVTKSILQAGMYSSGVPAQPNALWNNNVARLRQLDEMADRLKVLEKNIGERNGDRKP
jgi:UDP-3-O-[3-hydroxymyristoyl] glucosamine N-acyltransferase